MRFWFGALFGVVLLAPVWADEAIPMSIAELTQHAQLVVRGKVEAKAVKRDAEHRIFTEIKLAVEEVWKGDPKKPLLTVVHGGGILGEQKATAFGQVSYEPGEEVVGFFVWNERGEAVTISMSQGKFHVARNAEGAEVANPFHGRDPAAAASPKAALAASKLTLDDLRARVREATR